MTSPSDSGTPVAPSRVICSIWNGEASTRIFLPLRSASVRIGARMSKAYGPVQNRLPPIRPLLAPSAMNALAKSGSAMVLSECWSSLNRPGTLRSSKRWSTPTRNSGGPTQIWIEPSCVPSIMRGMAPSWLAG